MGRSYGGETVVDSSVFLSILKQESLAGPCSAFLEELKTRNKRVCVTSVIIKEVVEAMDTFIKNLNEKKSYLRETDEKNYREMWASFLTNFNNLLTENVKILYPLKNFDGVFKKSYTRMRVGDKDKINLSLSMSNNCREFVTCDGGIYHEQETIKEISELSLEIILIE